MVATIKSDPETAYNMAKHNILYGGLTIVSEPHGKAHGFAFGAKLIEDIGKAENRTLFLEMPVEFEKEKSSEKLIKLMIDQAQKFDHGALRLIFDTALKNEWRIKCADSEYYQLMSNMGKEARQEGIAKRLIEGMRDANGGLFPVGGKHITGESMGRRDRQPPTQRAPGGQGGQDDDKRYGYWGIAQYIPKAELAKIYKFDYSGSQKESETLRCQYLEKRIFKKF